MLIVNDVGCQLSTTGRLVKVDVRQTLDSCLAALKSIHVEEERQKERAALHFERARQAGYANGQAIAADEWSQKFAEWAMEQHSFQAEIMTALVQVVLVVLRQYFSTQGDVTLIEGFVRHAWERIGRFQSHLTLHVAPSLVEQMRERLKALLKAHPHLLSIEVLAKDELMPTECEVGSNMGWVKLSLASQLEQLSEAFEGVVLGGE